MLFKKDTFMMNNVINISSDTIKWVRQEMRYYFETNDLYSAKICLSSIVDN